MLHSKLYCCQFEAIKPAIMSIVNLVPIFPILIISGIPVTRGSNIVQVSSLPALQELHYLQNNQYQSPLRYSQTQAVSRHACDVIDKNVSSDVCSVSVSRYCRNEIVDIGELVTKEQCHDAVKTVCTVLTDSVQFHRCRYQYHTR